MKKFAVLCSVLLSAAFAAAPFTLSAETAKEIQDRMKARSTEVTALRATKIVGESNKGYLVLITESKLTEGQDKTMKEENADRKKVYTAIAAKESTTEEVVGKRRAIKIRTLIKKGEFWQDEAGAWKEKKD